MCLYYYGGNQYTVISHVDKYDIKPLVRVVILSIILNIFRIGNIFGQKTFLVRTYYFIGLTLKIQKSASYIMI